MDLHSLRRSHKGLYVGLTKTRYLSSFSAAIVIMAFTVASATEPDVPIAPNKQIKLFNGKNLSGWTTWLVDANREDPRSVYSVRDGMLRISGDGFGYLSTDRAYRDYRLVTEVKWGTQNFRTRKGMARDSGVFLHGVGPNGGSYGRMRLCR